MTERPENGKEISENLLKRIADIDVIEGSTGTSLAERADLAQLVEGPLLSACEELYDKNIATKAASANRKDIETGDAYIVIDFDKLSDGNKEVAKSLGGEFFEYQGAHTIRLNIPVTESSTWGDVQAQAESLVHQFHKQPFEPETMTLEERKRMYYIEPDDDSIKPESLGGYWVPEEKKFYRSEEQYKKAKEK